MTPDQSDYIKQLEETVSSLQSTLDTTVKQLDKNKSFLPSWSKHLFEVPTGQKFDTWVLSYPNTLFDKNKFDINSRDMALSPPAYILKIDKKYRVKIYGENPNKITDCTSFKNAVKVSVRALYGPNTDVKQFSIEE